MGAVRRLRREVTAALSRHDLPLAAAGLTFYLALGGIPALLVGGRLAALVVGAARIRETGTAFAHYLPPTLHAAHGVQEIAGGAAGLGWGSAIGSVVVVSLFAEGLLRALDRFTDAERPQRRSRLVRGRLLTLLVIAASAVVAGLMVGVARPLLNHSFGTGTGPRLFGIWLAFVIGWVIATAVLVAVYRVFPGVPLRGRALAIGSSLTASWLVGQALGYDLVLRWVGGDTGRLYGGWSAAGAVSATLFLVYLETVVFLLGWVLTLGIARMSDA